MKPSIPSYLTCDQVYTDGVYPVVLLVHLICDTGSRHAEYPGLARGRLWNPPRRKKDTLGPPDFMRRETCRTARGP